MINSCYQTITKLLGIQDFIVKAIEEKEGQIWIYGEVEKPASCPHCKGKESREYKGKEQRIRHQDIWGKKSYLVLWHPSYQCTECGLFYTPQWSFAQYTPHYTDAFVKEIVRLAQGSSLVHVSWLLDEPYSNVERMYYDYLMKQDGPKRLRWQAKHIGFDEIAIRKGHGDFILIVYDLDKGLVLDILPDRKQATLKNYLCSLPPETRASIQSVCIDMWWPYRDCILKELPSALIIIDRFHIAKELNKAIDKIRKQLLAQGQFAQLSGEERKQLTWAVRYSPKMLRKKPKYKRVLKKAMKLSKPLRQVLALRSQFKQIFDRKRPQEVRPRITEWLRQASRTKLAPILDFLKTFHNWRTWIMMFVPLRYTNAAAEGLNNKIKLIKRLGFGFESIVHFRLRILHTCGYLTLTLHPFW